VRPRVWCAHFGYIPEFSIVCVVLGQKGRKAQSVNDWEMEKAEMSDKTRYE
jgi:hypothetical protein